MSRSILRTVSALMSVIGSYLNDVSYVLNYAKL